MNSFQLGAISPLRYFSIIAVVLGLVFATISGDDEQMKPWQPFVLWQIQSCLPMALLVVSHLALNKIYIFEKQNPWFKLAVSGVLGACMFTPFALALDVFYRGELLEHNSWWLSLLDELLAVSVPVAVTWVAINSPWVLGFKFEPHQPSAGGYSQLEQGNYDHPMPHSLQKGAAPAAPTAIINKEVKPQTSNVKNTTSELQSEVEIAQSKVPAFFKSMPAELHAPVIYIKAELHYISVVTDAGKHLLLYNLKDAIEQINKKGVRPHRSYWVAQDRISTFQKHGREGRLILTNGEAIPVSRRNIQEVTKLIATL